MQAKLNHTLTPGGFSVALLIWGWLWGCTTCAGDAGNAGNGGNTGGNAASDGGNADNGGTKDGNAVGNEGNAFVPIGTMVPLFLSVSPFNIGDDGGPCRTR